MIHGGIDHIQSNPVARYFLAVPARAGLREHANTTLTAQGARLELLGHVTNPV